MIRAFLMGAMALYFSFITYNNLTDFQTNWENVQLILSMTEIENHTIAWRAFNTFPLQMGAYILIIVWEAITAILFWIGSLFGSKRASMIGLLFAFLLFFIGFFVFASEWFYMWASSLRSMQEKALLFSILTVALMIYIERSVDDKSGAESS